MHSRGSNDGSQPGRLVRALRGLVFVALLPAMLVAGVILLPVFAIGRLAGLGPRGRGCGCRRGGPGDAAGVA